MPSSFAPESSCAAAPSGRTMPSSVTFAAASACPSPCESPPVPASRSASALVSISPVAAPSEVDSGPPPAPAPNVPLDAPVPLDSSAASDTKRSASASTSRSAAPEVPRRVALLKSRSSSAVWFSSDSKSALALTVAFTFAFWRLSRTPPLRT